MDEIWKVIENFPNYSVSTYGRVRNNTTGLILKQGDNGRGYKHVGLYSDTIKNKTIMVHRLVALAFLPNPNNLPEINHIDENKENNCIENLEWCTSEYNINHGTHNLRIGMNNPNRKPIYSITQTGDVMYFDSAKYAQRYYASIGIELYASGINKALKYEVDTYKNMAWYYQSDLSGLTNYHEKFSSKKEKRKFIRCTDNDGNVTHFGCMNEALRLFNLKQSQRKYLKEALSSGCIFMDRIWEYD